MTNNPYSNSVNQPVIQRDLNEEQQNAFIRTMMASQKKLVRNQMIMWITLLVIAFMLCVLTVVLTVNITKFSFELKTIETKAMEVVEKAEESLDLLQTFVTELQDSMKGINTLIENANITIVDSQDGIVEALDKINQIDIEALNHSIKDLGAIIAPIAHLFNK